MKNIAILTGGDSAEHDISILSAKTVLKNLNKSIYNGYLIHLKEGLFTAVINQKNILLNKEDFSLTINNKKIYFDAVFMALHGSPAEDGLIQPYFDKLNIPYNSCNSKISDLTFNKYQCNKKIKKIGFNCAKSYLHHANKKINIDMIIEKVGIPCFVKPNKSGSSYGISKITKKENLHIGISNGLRYDNNVIIEEFINGTEVSVGVFEDENRIQSLPITEIISYNDFFDYEAKYNGKSKEITPARINSKLTAEIQKTSIKIYQSMDLRGICRIDYIIKEDKPFVIEINTIPGLSEESIIPKQLKCANIKLSDFFELCLNKIIN